MLSRFYLIPQRHGQTDKRTDGRTDRQNIAISIPRISVLTRDKNETEARKNGEKTQIFDSSLNH